MVEGTIEMRATWTCSSCSMTSRRPEVGAVPMPVGWRETDGGLQCLGCAGAADPAWRERVAKERAAEKARARKREAHRQKRENEERSEETRRQVAGERERRKRERQARRTEPKQAKPEARRPRRRPGPKSDPAIEVALRADPDRLDREIAAELDVNPQKVGKARRRLGLPTSTERRITAARRDVAAALGRTGEAGAAEVAAASGLNFQTARTRLEELVADGSAVSREPAQRRKGAARTLYRPAD